MKRIIIKLSGEALSNKEKNLSIDPFIVNLLCEQIKEIKKTGIEIGVVVGGGNFWRGASAEKKGMSRNRADYIGMLATIMNGLALQSAFESVGLKARMQSSLQIDNKVGENYVNEKAMNALSKGEIVVFSGGTGRPFFTTDTTSTLIACETKADLILMGKNGVSGIYDKDPKKNKDAKHFKHITYDQLLEKNLTVMDSTAASMAKDNGVELIVFDITEKNAILRAIKNDIKHTKVTK